MEKRTCKRICPGPLSKEEMNLFSKKTQRVEKFSKLKSELTATLETPTPSEEQILEFE